MTDRTLRLLVAATLLTAPAATAAQDIVCEGEDVEVRHLRFSGNRAFGDFALANGIHTEQSSLARRWLRFFGKRKCLDRTLLPQDAFRIKKFYGAHGYRAATVDFVVTPGDTSARKVSVEFRIHEGPPMRVDAVEITGLDAHSGRADVVAKLPIKVGDPFDQDSIAATINTIRRRLRDDGYPTADVFPELTTDSASLRGSVRLEVVPGTRAHVDSIKIEITPRVVGDPQISRGTVRRVLGVREGDLYRERLLERGLRNLYLTDAYATTAVNIDSADTEPPGDSLVTIHVRLTENYMRSATASGGWGTLDCFRAQGEFAHNNFLRDARRFEARVRLSKIGIGRPLSGAAPLCHSSLRNDPFSSKLNYYAGVTVSDRTLSVLGMRPSFTLFSERRSEYKAFLKTTPGGALVTATRDADQARRSQHVSYQLEYGRTEAQPAIFCALFNLCVPEDREPLLDYRRLAVASWSARQDWTDVPLNPSRGGVASLEIRHASSGIGSNGDLQFSKATGDVSFYLSLGRGIVLASRLRSGAVVGPAFTGLSRFIPSEERLFAGGATTVRGFNQNDMGPKVYIARGYDTVRVAGATGAIAPAETVYFRTPEGATAERSVPTGGSSLVVANLELRTPSPVFSNLILLTFFADVGELWSPGARQSQDQFRNLKVTPGLGMRFLTFVGLLGIDIAYNPYAPRAGAVFFDTPVDLGGQLYCVSPGNDLAVSGLGVAGSPPVQASGSCAASFRPPSRTGFLNKLKLHFAIGHAF